MYTSRLYGCALGLLFGNDSMTLKELATPECFVRSSFGQAKAQLFMEVSDLALLNRYKTALAQRNPRSSPNVVMIRLVRSITFSK